MATHNQDTARLRNWARYISSSMKSQLTKFMSNARDIGLPTADISPIARRASDIIDEFVEGVDKAWKEEKNDA